MMTHDYQKFQATMAKLSVAFGKELSPALTDIYWEALKSLAIEQFQEGANSWIRTHKFFPKAAEILERFKQLDEAKLQGVTVQLPPLEGKWLRLVNGLFLQYLQKRRFEDGFRGDVNIPSRRNACRDLAEFFEGLEAENDPEATEVELAIRFDRCMARIPDLSQDDAWLPIELERQRLQDEERKRASR